jgi:hypothetical protein
VHFQHDLWIAEIQLVVALVDEDALGVEHRPHRAIEEVDVFVGNSLDEVHKKKAPRRVTWGSVNVVVLYCAAL